MLSLEQSREYNRGKKLTDFLVLNQSVYALFQPFVDEVAHFTTNFNSLNELSSGKNAIATGITADKRDLKQKLATGLALVCRKTLAYANRYDKPELAAQTNIREDLVFKMKDADLAGYAQSIKKLLLPLLADTAYLPYGLTQPGLDALVADAETFSSMIGRADVTTSGNTVANSAINRVIAAIREDIKQLNLLVDEFAESNPAFVESYRINSTIENTGTRRSGIEGRVEMETGTAIVGATVQLEGITKSTLTDLNGFYRINYVPAGDYYVICDAPGHAAQRVVHHIYRGRMKTIDFTL